MKKQMIRAAILTAAAVFAAATQLRAQQGAEHIILADFQNPPGGAGAVDGTQIGLVTNLPGGSWIWGKGWHWGTPSINYGSFNNAEEGTATGLPLTNNIGYVKPALMTVRGTIYFSAGSRTESGIAFWSHMESGPPAIDDTSSYIGATGVVIEYGTGRVRVLYGDGTFSPPAWAEHAPDGIYALEYSVNTDTGELVDTVVNGKPVTGLESYAFSDEATRYVGFISLTGSRLNAYDFSLTTPAFPGLPWIVSRGIRDITADSVKLSGYVGQPGAAPFSVTLCYGAEDEGTGAIGDWAESLPLPSVNTVGAFEHTLTGIDPDTRYFFRFCITDDTGATAWSPHAFDFLTLGAAVLGDVSYEISPSAVTFTADVIQPGFNGVLSLNWGTQPGVFPHTLSTNNFEAGLHTFTVTNLSKYDHCYYELILASQLASFTNSGDFTVVHTYKWRGGGGLWSNPLNWDANLVPDAPSDIVRINDAGTAPDFFGMPDATIGQLIVRTPWAYENLTHIRKTDLTQPSAFRLIFDNGAEPALIDIGQGNAARLRFSAPLRLDSPTRVRSGDGVVFLATEIDGAEPLVLEQGFFAFTAEAGDTLTVSHPIIHGTTGESTVIQKRGAGEVILADADYTLRMCAGYMNPTIYGGGIFTLSNTTLTHENEQNAWSIFYDADNTWRIINGSKYVNDHNSYTGINGDRNTLLVSGYGSEFLIPNFGFRNSDINSHNASYNKIEVRDGATLKLRSGTFRGNGHHNAINIAGSESGAPATFDINGATLDYNGGTNTIAVGSGGVLTNGNVSLTGAGSSLRLEGGEVSMEGFTFTLGEGCVLTPVFSAEEILPIRATYADFREGCAVTPENLGNFTGRYKILVADGIEGDANIHLADPPGNFQWKLSTTQSDGQTTVWISCGTPVTVILLR